MFENFIRVIKMFNEDKRVEENVRGNQNDKNNDLSMIPTSEAESTETNINSSVSTVASINIFLLKENKCRVL